MLKHKCKQKQLKQLHELDKSILSFFIENGKEKATLHELISILPSKAIEEVLESLIRLSKHNIIYISKSLHISIQDIPSCLQLYLGLTRYNTALLLYVIIFSEKEVFSYDDIISTGAKWWETSYTRMIRKIYAEDKNVVWKGFYELVKKGYLIPLRRKVYRINIPPSVIAFVKVASNKDLIT